MTGAPAETWRKFTAKNSPPWAFWVGGILLSAALSERASGYLPLTRASAARMLKVRVAFFSLLPLCFVLWGIGVVVASAGPSNPVNSTIFILLFLLGLGALFGGLVAVILGRRALGPEAKLLDRQPGQFEPLIELRNVHPTFVTAVRQLQQARAQSAYPAGSPLQPNWK
jgi:hypothetical protein